MKSILVLSLMLSQFVFAKTIDEETKERIAIVNQAAADRAFEVSGRLSDLAAAMASKLTNSGVLALELIQASPMKSAHNEDTIYNDYTQESTYGVRLMSGDICEIVLTNKASPTSDHRAIQLAGTVKPLSGMCVGPQGETVAETRESYSSSIISSINGVQMRTDEPVAEYTFVTFDPKL
ncbi:MAG: hypothetical protein H7328_00790 [Bdellovibrio sp.]|nr:hypothetical protein [Bdellovibrio sp.]